jgi:predicted CoA-binding protein
MTAPETSLETIQDFLAQKRIAIAGVSRDPNSLSVKLFDEFSRRGYDVVPVNPNISDFRGKRCYGRVQDVRPLVDAMLIMTPPAITNILVRDCAEAGIRRVWMYSAVVAGAVSEEAVQFCRDQGIRLVRSQCPFMFLPEAAGIHRLHGFLRKITGHFPRLGASQN